MMNRLFKIEIIRSLVDVGVKANDHQNMEMIITAVVDDDAQKSALCVCVCGKIKNNGLVFYQVVKPNQKGKCH